MEWIPKRLSRKIVPRFDFFEDVCVAALVVFFLLLSLVIFRSDLAPIAGVAVQIPQSETVWFYSGVTPVLVVVDKDGRFYFRHQLMNQGLLYSNLNRISHVVSSNVPLVVRADKHLNLDTLMRVYDVCQRAGISNLILEVIRSKPTQ